jgi:hypothetical protein
MAVARPTRITGLGLADPVLSGLRWCGPGACCAHWYVRPEAAQLAAFFPAFCTATNAAWPFQAAAERALSESAPSQLRVSSESAPSQRGAARLACAISRRSGRSVGAAAPGSGRVGSDPEQARRARDSLQVGPRPPKYNCGGSHEAPPPGGPTSSGGFPEHRDGPLAAGPLAASGSGSPAQRRGVSQESGESAPSQLRVISESARGRLFSPACLTPVFACAF